MRKYHTAAAARRWRAGDGKKSGRWAWRVHVIGGEMETETREGVREGE